MTKKLTYPELTELIEQVLIRHGLLARGARIVAEVVASAERDGSNSHGLARMEGYVSTLKSGWVNGRAVPHVVDICASYDGAVDFSFFLLPTCIEIARCLGRGPDLTDAFARDYYDAIERLRDCVIARISDDWDETFAMSLVAALAASKGQIRVANAIINLDGDLMDRIIEGDF